MRSRPTSLSASGASSEAHPDGKQRPSSNKRQQVAVACVSCQVRKCKCDEQKPSCASCLRKGTNCVYEIDGDCRRVDQLRRKNTALTERCQGLEHLLTCLRSCSESGAAELLQRVRTDEHFIDTVNFARTGPFQSNKIREQAAYTQPSTSTVFAAQQSTANSWNASGGGIQSMGATPCPADISSSESDPSNTSDLAAREFGTDPSSGEASSERWFWSPEAVVKSEELDSPAAEIVDQTVTTAQPPRFEQSPSRSSDKLKKKGLQPSPLRNSDNSVFLRELEKVPTPTSMSSLPRTESRIEMISNLRMQNSSSDTLYGSQVSVSRIPIHLMLPIWQDDDAPINRVISDYLSAARQQIARGSPVAEILAPEYINVQAFFQPRNTLRFPTVSEWASEVNKNLLDMHIFVRLANVLLQTYLMRVSNSALCSK